MLVVVLLVAGGPALVARADPPGPDGPVPISPPGLDLPGIQRWIDSVVPRPELPVAGLPEVESVSPAAESAALLSAVLPDPVGDPMFDARPPGLDDLAPGDVVETRDVTGVAAPLFALPLTAPVRQVVQVKYRTADARGEASFATASLVLPAAAWAGPGERPVLVNNLAIDGLGRRCTPGYTLAHGYSETTNSADFFPPLSQLALLRGYAVLIPDHEGPNMAYAEPFVAGHAVLDAVRAARALLPGELGGSRYVMAGYSGGAIATRAAAALIGSYAPDLAESITGAAVGGVPADFRMLADSMNGNLATGVFMSAVFGIGREHPEILTTMNNLARQVTTSPLKNVCMNLIEVPGATLAPIDIAANIPDPLHSPVAERVFAATDMSGMKSGVPLLVYNGAHDFWIPAAGAEQLFRQQCAMGVAGIYRSVPGEHFLAGDTGWPLLIGWLDQRLQGEPAPDEC
ncbi:pimeloyl-ACP methyl ester carboxylesterase [Nocardia transvalensis]|uniref:Pimeloyl-ACP methyl ester carboxylesterase n=2 Tax=Nocardia transvalensis TaxID=37333 RepID=A0A7W9ULB3_9NOCA|nr:pimeloyl-ACP methyl ester carboxylesterase [Nocardia transvalensis]